MKASKHNRLAVFALRACAVVVVLVCLRNFAPELTYRYSVIALAGILVFLFVSSVWRRLMVKRDSEHLDC